MMIIIKYYQSGIYLTKKGLKIKSWQINTRTIMSKEWDTKIKYVLCQKRGKG